MIQLQIWQIWDEILDKYDMKFWTNVRWKADKYKMEVQCEDWSPVAVSSGGRGRHTKLKPTPSLAAFCCFSIYHHFFTPQPVGDRGGRMLLLFRCGSTSNGCCTGDTWLLIWPLAKSTWYFGKVNAKAQLFTLNLTQLLKALQLFQIYAKQASDWFTTVTLSSMSIWVMLADCANITTKWGYLRAWLRYVSLKASQYQNNFIGRCLFLCFSFSRWFIVRAGTRLNQSELGYAQIRL